MGEFRFARVTLALAGLAFLAVGCGDHRPVWRQAGLPKSSISLLPPGASVAAQPVQVAGPAAAAVTESRAVRAEPRPLPKKPRAADSARISHRPPPRAPVQVAAAGAAHFVQVGAHRTRAASEKMWNRLQSLHPRQLGAESHFIVRRDFGAPRGTYFQIQLGPFVDRRAADAKCAALQSARIDCFVVRTRLERVTLPAAGGPSPGAALVNAPVRAAPPPPAREKAEQFIRSGLGQGDDND